MSIRGYNNIRKLPRIGIIGSSECSLEIRKIAFEVGYGVAKKGAVLICGGLGGVMEAACEGAKKANGLTIGILPGFDRGEANPFVDIPIATGISIARNLIIVRSSDALIAIAGGFGTLSEIGFALNLSVPVIGLHTWEIEAPIIQVATAEQAVNRAFSVIKQLP